MAGTSRATVIGRSMQDVATAWGTLQPFFGNADLIISERPAERAIVALHNVDACAVFVVLDVQADFERILHSDAATARLILLCRAGVMQRILPGLRPLPFPVLPLEDADLALSTIRLQSSRRGQSSSRQRL